MTLVAVYQKAQGQRGSLDCKRLYCRSVAKPKSGEAHLLWDFLLEKFRYTCSVADWSKTSKLTEEKEEIAENHLDRGGIL